MARSGVLFRVPFGMNTKLECRGGKMVFALAAMFAVFVVAGCSKAQPTSVLGDASHPAPVRFYTVAEETARRRIQAVGSLYALEESTLSSEVEGRVAEVLADVGDNLISRQQLDEAASRYQSTKATYTVALQEVDRLKALLVSSEASEKLSEKKLNDSTIRAPFPGAIKTRDVHPGEYLRVQSPV